MSHTISHSSLPTRLGITGRTLLSLRSALVNVPSFSKKELPGRKTCAYLAVSLRKRSCTTTRSIEVSACRTWCRLGSDWAMSSPCTKTPLNVPPIAASNMLGIRRPGSGLMFTCHSDS